MFYRTPLDIRVSIDVGCKSHQVAVGLSTGEFLEEFSISHQPEGFRLFFAKLEQLEQQYQCPVRVAMEGYNGYARPLDSMVLARGWQLNNINNLKLARFKEIFPGAAKSDVIDARRGLELFQLMDHLPTAKKVLQVVAEPPRENQILKRLSRRRRRLVNERVRVLNNLQADLQAVCPSLLAIESSHLFPGIGLLDRLFAARSDHDGGVGQGGEHCLVAKIDDLAQMRVLVHPLAQLLAVFGAVPLVGGDEGKSPVWLEQVNCALIEEHIEVCPAGGGLVVLLEHRR